MFSFASLFKKNKSEPLRPDIEAINQLEAKKAASVDNDKFSKFIRPRSLSSEYRRYQEESALESRLEPLLKIIRATHPSWSECEAVKCVIVAGMEHYSKPRAQAVLKDFMAKIALMTREESDAAEQVRWQQSMLELKQAVAVRYGEDFAHRSLLSPVSSFRYSWDRVQAAKSSASDALLP